MNAARFIHTANFARQTDAIGGDGRRTISLTALATDQECLVEGLRGRAKNSLAGRIDGASYTVSWAGLVLRDGDICTWNGKQYSVRDIIDDSTRPTGAYYSAILQERAR